MSVQTLWKNFPFEEITLEPGNFADELKGLRIVQLSDLHIKRSLDIGYLERTFPTDFTAIITDVTGVDIAYAVFDNASIALTIVGDEYTGTLTTAFKDKAVSLSACSIKRYSATMVPAELPKAANLS